MKADLVSNLLDFNDLAGFIGGNAGNSFRQGRFRGAKKARCRQKRTAIGYFLINATISNVCELWTLTFDLRAKKILAPKFADR